MILLSHEVKLKLQELVKANRESAQTTAGQAELENYAECMPITLDLLIKVDELIACLPPEVMAGLDSESNRS